MFWLKAVADWNMLPMSTTLATFQAPMFWSKTAAFLKLSCMLLTEATFQLRRLWLNAEAVSNVAYMLDTDAVFHLEMSSLNVGWLANTEARFVTTLTSQYPIGPYVAAAVLGLVAHAVTAAPMLPSARHASIPALPQLHVGYAARSVAPHIMYIAPLVELESAVVPSKAKLKVVTRSTFQLARFWLKAEAVENMVAMFDTLAVFQLPMFWLKADARSNDPLRSVTEHTFQLPTCVRNR